MSALANYVEVEDQDDVEVSLRLHMCTMCRFLFRHCVSAKCQAYVCVLILILTNL